MKTRISLSSLIAACLLFGSVAQAQQNPPASAKAPTKVDVTVTVRSGDAPQDEPAADVPFEGKRASVDVAILLDTSNSMDGLISQAKTQLWNIVQQFARAKKNGQTPVLRVSVFEYGNSGLPATEGYIRQVVGLTDDLDRVSEALFSLNTNGGDEYCGQVIGEAIKRLNWSAEPNGFKAIFIAGNEPFTQGEVDYRESCRQAIEKGIVVNTIHCGTRSAGISGDWKAGADLAEGAFLNINQDRRVVHIECPQDEIIIRLNARLNKTYLWYGAEGGRHRQNQIAQDSNAEELNRKAILDRAVAKSGALYRNVGRDLVDSYADDNDVLSNLKKSELPEPMREMTVEQQRALIVEMTEERATIKAEIARLNRERAEYIQQQTEGRDDAEADTFGRVVNEAVQGQMESADFSFER